MDTLLFRGGSMMKLQRLGKMGLAELAGRGRQEASKWLERMAVGGKKNGRTDTAFKKPLPGSVSDDLFVGNRDEDLLQATRSFLDSSRNVSAERFFEGAVSGQTVRLIEAMTPDAGTMAITRADALCQKRFDLLGYRGLCFGDPVDWQLDPVAGRRAPLVHWSRIDPLDSKKVGDSKVVWELNRHQWLVDLGQVYRFSGDERYAENFAACVRAWMEANPRGLGINWASSLEVAFRLIAWCWALFLFRGARALSRDLCEEMLGWIRGHAAHVERYLSYYFSPNTHLTGEALGLFYAGVVFPELKGADRWRALGRRILIEQLDHQVLRDGVYFEQSTYYQRYTVEIYLHFLILALRNGIALPSRLEERTQAMLDFLLALLRPDGTIPQIGDADGGWLLPFIRRAPEDYRGVFSTAAALFGRADYAWAAKEVAPETLWLLGAPGHKAFEALDVAPPREANFDIFPHGGYAVMRSGWDEKAHQLIFDAGPLGCPISGAHGHADLLSIQCVAFGEVFLVDPGTGCYTADPKWRDHFRSTAAHSTVMVDGKSQAETAGPFSWVRRPRARFRRRISTEDYDLVDADHDAYHRLSDPVRHRRRVFFAKPRYFVIVDDLEGGAEHHVDLRFQFTPIKISLEQGGWIRARGSSGHGLLLRSFAAAPLKPVLAEAGMDPSRGWVSPNYGQREPAPVVSFEAYMRLPFRIVTLILPVADPDAPPPAITVLGDDVIAGLEFNSWQERVGIGAHDIYLERT